MDSGRTQVEEAAGGTSFEDFYRREFRSVFGLAYVLTGDRWTAEDLTQDAFLSAQREWDRVGVYDNPGAWVRRVLSNRCIAWFRRLRTERRMLPLLRSNPGLTSELPAESTEVWEAVRTLPRRQAQVVALTYLDGRTLEEIGGILGCSPLTAKTHLQRAKATLARKLGTEGGMP